MNAILGNDQKTKDFAVFRTLMKASLVATAMLAPSMASAQSAPNVATLSSNALLIKPLSLTKIDDLSFGSLIPTGGGDWVKIDADTGLRTFSNPSMRIPTDEGFRARFASSGLNNVFVVLELDGPPVLTNPAGKTITVMSMVLDQNNKVLRKLTPTSQVFFVGVGGTLFIRGDQEEGVYTGDYTLTATYL